MEHVSCVKTGYNPAHIQVACDGTYIALPITRTTIGVWRLNNITRKPLQLEGHRKILTSLVFGNVPSPKMLCSSAEDYVIVWNLQLAMKKAEKGEKIKGVIIGTTLGYIQYCAFNPIDTLVAACCDNDVLILRSNTSEVIAALEGHTNRVTCAEFCPHYSSTLVTISEDRTYKVWNIEDLSLVYQSPIITASPFISIAMNLNQPQVAIGTADGIVRIYDMADGNDFRCIHQLDVGKIMNKYRDSKEQFSTTVSKNGPVTISSKPSYQRTDGAEPRDEAANQDVAETGCAILGLYFSWLPQESRQPSAASVSSVAPGFIQRNNTMIRELFEASPMLLVGTTGALLQINAKSLEVTQYYDLQDQLESSKEKAVFINNAGSTYFSQGEDPEKICCVIGSHFQNHVHVLQWEHASTKSKPCNFSTMDHLSVSSSQSGENDAASSKPLTVLSSDPLLPDSILRQDLVPKQKEDSSNKKQRISPRSKKPGQGVKDQPLTFNSKVKSSGYTEAPRTTMFKPKTSFTKTQSSVKKKSITSLLDNALDKEYPSSPGPQKYLLHTTDVAERPTAVNTLSYSGDGLNLACGLANKSAQVFKASSLDKGSYSLAHNHIVNDVQWSCDSNWLITACDDKMVRIWNRGQTEAVMTITTRLHNLVEGEGQKKDKENGPFPKEIKKAQFYYMDRFLLLTSSNTLYMYKYHLDPSKQDIKRYASKSKYKQVQSFSMDAQQITAMSAVNDFYSYIVICAGSSKSLEIYDMNVGKSSRTIADVHTRPVHCIKQHEGSKFASHPRDAYDLFLTAAAGDCIKLWDLRANRCVRRYEGHLNRSYPCGADLSPCGQYVATGSEDKCVYVYDIRGGSYCSKLTGFTDTTSCVAFHPLHSQLMTASLDGKLKLFTDKK